MPRPDVVAALAQSYLFRHLPTGALESLADTATVRRLGIGEALCEPGDPADELYVVMTGEVKDSVVSLDGDEVVHFLHGPGMTLGEPGSSPSTGTGSCGLRPRRRARSPGCTGVISSHCCAGIASSRTACSNDSRRTPGGRRT